MSRSQDIQAVYFSSINDAERCTAMVYSDSHGRLDRPRRCKAKAKNEGYCGPHAKQFSTIPHVTSSDGGWCIWCGQPARRYACPRDLRVTIDFCGGCGTGLYRALQHHTKKTKRKVA